MSLEDYAQELAFLPGLTEPSVTELDYTVLNVKNPSFVGDQQDDSMMARIDVQGHAPIKQRARRIPLRHLQKLYELLNGLLKAGLSAFSDSPCASPIVLYSKRTAKIFDYASITR
ncbi:hypothetical protein PHMEG_00036693 [Phytophthora megakarya]|uniref:Reverse transcriptase n=1 Tax=Phytophthora megakarya TaxID=4795 RepID=A0A225ULI0_9STRA|nr:hypothetical protein PHMEG_00036693 [Phytophthora megakarya]